MRPTTLRRHLPMASLNLSTAQIDAVRRLLKDEVMCETKYTGCHFRAAGEGTPYSPVKFAVSVLRSLLSKEIVVFTKEFMGTKSYVLNPEKRASLEAYLATDAVQAKMFKLTPAQKDVIDRLKNGWTLLSNWRDDEFTLQEQEFRYGRRMNMRVPAATARSLLALELVQLHEKIPAGHAYRLNRERLAQGKL